MRYNTIDKKKGLYLHPTEKALDLLKVKCASLGMSMSDFISTMVINDDDEFHIIDNINKKIENINLNYKSIVEVLKSKIDEFKKDIERETEHYEKMNKELLEEREKKLQEMLETNTDKGEIRKTTLKILRNYIRKGKEYAIRLIDGYCKNLKINKLLLTSSVNRTISIYENMSDNDKQTIKNMSKNSTEFDNSTELIGGL